MTRPINGRRDDCLNCKKTLLGKIAGPLVLTRSTAIR
jgi:hypothetical protein